MNDAKPSIKKHTGENQVECNESVISVWFRRHNDGFFVAVLVLTTLFIVLPRIRTSERILLLIIAVLVVTVETLNTAFEDTMDTITLEYSYTIKNVKDMLGYLTLCWTIFLGLVFVLYAGLVHRRRSQCTD